MFLMMQSILRQANFKGANLLGASFFDADLTSTELLATPSSMVPVLVPCHWKVCDLVFAVWLTGYVCRRIQALTSLMLIFEAPISRWRI